MRKGWMMKHWQREQMPRKWKGKEGRDRNCDRDWLRDIEREGEE